MGCVLEFLVEFFGEIIIEGIVGYFKRLKRYRRIKRKKKSQNQ